MTIARATAASAAARTITNRLNICPSKFIPPNLENATKLILAALSINSTPIKTAMPFLRVMTPKTPSENKTEEINK